MYIANCSPEKLSWLIFLLAICSLSYPGGYLFFFLSQDEGRKGGWEFFVDVIDTNPRFSPVIHESKLCCILFISILTMQRVNCLLHISVV